MVVVCFNLLIGILGRKHVFYTKNKICFLVYQDSSNEKGSSLPSRDGSRFGSGSITGSRGRDGWRLSKSSVSSIYHSAQDMSEYYFSDDGEPMSPSFRSYHSIQESLCFDTDRDDIFSSPAGSMTFHPGNKKVDTF